jgi:hypothetical protein
MNSTGGGDGPAGSGDGGPPSGGPPGPGGGPVPLAVAEAVPLEEVPLVVEVPLAVAVVKEPLPLFCRTRRRPTSLLCGTTTPTDVERPNLEHIAISRGTPDV